MTTTTEPTTPTLTLADRYRIAGDFIARTDLNLYGLHISPYTVSVQVNDAKSLQFAASLLDDATVSIQEYEESGSIHVLVDGGYRGLNCHFFDGFYDGATMDLIRSFPEPNVGLLAVLAGDAPVEA
jgi:hypothetical protein